MTSWNKDSALEWFRRQGGRHVVVRERGGTLAVRGVCEGPEEIDACSSEVPEVRIALERTAAAEVSLTFHDEAASLSVYLPGAGTGRPEVYLPLRLPYERLLLDTAEAAAGGPAERPVRSPYALLH